MLIAIALVIAVIGALCGLTALALCRAGAVEDRVLSGHLTVGHPADYHNDVPDEAAA